MKEMSMQMETKRKALAAECQGVKPTDMPKLAAAIAMAQLETLIAMLGHIERNVRN